MKSEEERLRRLFAALRRDDELRAPSFEVVRSASSRCEDRAPRLRPRLSLVLTTLAVGVTVVGVALLLERETVSPAIRIQTTPLALPLDCLLEPPSPIVAQTVPDFATGPEFVWGSVSKESPVGGTQ
ncbi:MAG: hypothetical protein AB1714_08070 [Acidobacteriota bacterium]